MYGNLEQHIWEQIQTCHPKGKTYTDAQLGELVHSIAVEKVKLLLNSSHLEPQAVKPPHHRRDDDSE
jgi:hypothetical protein